MHLETLKIKGFGCLRTTVQFAPEALNLAIADNEAGKSTLIAAILAAFYRIVEDERGTRDKRPRRKNVLLWNNPEEFGLTMLQNTLYYGLDALNGKEIYPRQSE